MVEYRPRGEAMTTLDRPRQVPPWRRGGGLLAAGLDVGRPTPVAGMLPPDHDAVARAVARVEWAGAQAIR